MFPIVTANLWIATSTTKWIYCSRTRGAATALYGKPIRYPTSPLQTQSDRHPSGNEISRGKSCLVRPSLPVFVFEQQVF